ncbi:MAG TPA: polysaccharide biosynthesis tyrosine autokinase [Chiayiivirga sp.]|nr:polysaccharide biosynthesis tyrosine autokinase [Chiayiivirga sp.]
MLAREDRPDDDEIDLLAYWRLLVKRRWLILGILVSVLSLVLIYTLLTPSTYRATASLEITPQGMDIMQGQGIVGRVPWDPDFAETQIELLKSRSLAQRVAEDLRLPGSDILLRLKPPSWMQRLRALVAPVEQAPPLPTVGRESVFEPTPAVAAPSNAAEEDETSASLEAAVGLVSLGLTIEQKRNTHLVQVHYTSTVPDFSAKVANAVAEGFIAASMDRQLGASSYASKFLQDQLEQLRVRLEDSEAALVKYAQETSLVPGASGTSLASQNLTDLNTQLAHAQSQRIIAEARWDSVKDASNMALPQDVLKDSVLLDLQKSLVKLQSEYQEKLRTFKPGFPEMVALQSQIDTIQRQVDSAANNIRASMKAQFDTAVAQETMLNQKLDELRDSVLITDRKSIQYNMLKRDVDTNRELYNAMLQRYKQFDTLGGARPSNISIIDHAQVPIIRFSPSLRRNLALGLLLGLFLGVGLALLLEFLDDTLKTPEDLETHLGIGVLGVVPRLQQQTPTQALRDPRSMFSESYRSVRTALQFSTANGTPRSLLVTSASPGEGKSTTAYTIALNFAQLGKRVLLIEADLRRPCLGRLVGVSSDVGLSSLLSGAATISQAIVRSPGNEFDMMLSGPLPPSPTELLASSKLVSLLTIAMNTYDQVVIDSAPVLGIADAPILANAVAGTLFIVQSGSSRIKASQLAVKRLHAARARLIGGVLTQHDMRVSGYSYGGYYGYGASPLLGHNK